MSRFALVCLAGCSTSVAEMPVADPVSDEDPIVPGTGWASGPWEDPEDPVEEPDLSAWEGAYARIISPAPGEVIPEGVPFGFEVGTFGVDGAPLEATAVSWFASGDPDFESTDFVFEWSTLAIGVHEITAIVDLPTGDRVAHAIGDVRVQSPYSGTYAGLFSVDGTVTQLTISCSGSAILVIGATGELGEGEGSCLVSLLGLDVPMTWLFTLENDAGTLTGSAGVDLAGFFSYDIPMTVGVADPEGSGLSLEFEGPIPFIGALSAFLEAPRLSLDAE